MRWKEIKDLVEGSGVTDDTDIQINISNINIPNDENSNKLESFHIEQLGLTVITYL